MLGRAGKLAEAFRAVNVARLCPQGQTAVLDAACSSSSTAYCASQRLFSSSLTTTTGGTNAESMTAVTKSLLLDTLNLVSAHFVVHSRKEAARDEFSVESSCLQRECKTCWTCLQMRRFEKVGLTRAQAEQVTELLTETICMNKVKITEQFVSKAALERVMPQLFWPALMPAAFLVPRVAFVLHALRKQNLPVNALF